MYRKSVDSKTRKSDLSQPNYARTVANLRTTFKSYKTHPYKWRIDQLKSLKAMTIENEEAIFAALKEDLRKSNFESFMTETGESINEINYALKHLKNWMKPEKVSTPMDNQPGNSKIIYEPLGVVLIIAPWNYPFMLIVSPLIGAISAGNCALIKPSELTPKTSTLLTEIIPEYMDSDAIKVMEGGPDVARNLLEQRFDHIFFTGSPRVGKIVMTAAAKYLTPVTLELGGKSPCIVNSDADLHVAAKRIVWGKFINAGQTCVAPDYVLADETIVDDLAQLIKLIVVDFYGDDPKISPDYSRIINQAHYERLIGLMDSGEIACGGSSDKADLYIEPTVLMKVSPDSLIMNEEIFGPILPIISVSDIEDAIGFVNNRAKPLALYLFTKDNDVQNKVISKTNSGGVCINDVLMHMVVPDLPFGGVGQSGIGAYHGRNSFKTFSHAKGVLIKSTYGDLPLRYPPYTQSKFKWLRRLG